MIRKIVIAAMLPAALAACSSDSLSRGGYGIGETAAVRALGKGAYTTTLVTPQRLKPGRIYKIGDGTFHEICRVDFRDQTKLQAIEVTSDEESADTIADREFLRGFQANLGVVGLGSSYAEKRTVTGFQNFHASAPTNDAFADYVLANVSQRPGGCYRKVLRQNRPYFIVESVSVGKRVSATRKIGITATIGIGIGSAGYTGEEEDLGTRTNVVFAASGKRVD